MLKIENLNTYYGHIHALQGVNLQVAQGEVVALIGSNGAGKTTTLSSIMNMARHDGTITFLDKNISNMDTAAIVSGGIALSPEGREVFPGLTVEENLKIGARVCKNKKQVTENYNYVYDLFPRLQERKRQVAGTLSGGEQQMLAIARALMSSPKLLMLDEPSLGLAPNIVQMIFEMITEINKNGVTVLLVEQNASMALRIADRGYVLETGRIVLEDDARALRHNSAVKKAYLGGAG